MVLCDFTKFLTAREPVGGDFEASSRPHRQFSEEPLELHFTPFRPTKLRPSPVKSPHQCHCMSAPAPPTLYIRDGSTLSVTPGYHRVPSAPALDNNFVGYYLGRLRCMVDCGKGSRWNQRATLSAVQTLCNTPACTACSQQSCSQQSWSHWSQRGAIYCKRCIITRRHDIRLLIAGCVGG